jgi:hypothetical protein
MVDVVIDRYKGLSTWPYILVLRAVPYNPCRVMGVFENDT